MAWRSPAAVAAGWTPSYNQDFPDPSVMVVNGSYYAYSTQVQVENVPGTTSPDGIDWTGRKADTLPSLPSWVASGHTWAPSVAQDDSGQFVMYYSALDGSFGAECLGRATSSSPNGPFVDDNSAPVLCQPSLGGSIDPDIFTGADGQSYLIWKNDGNTVGQRTYLWSEALGHNLQLQGTPTPLLSDDQGWQGGSIEGPNMVQAQGTFFLFYSGNLYASTHYAVGFATCSSPLGPCTDSPQNPVLVSRPGMSGPGGVSAFTGSNGQLMMAFAAWPGQVGYPNGGYRAMYVASVSFENGVPLFDPVEATPNGQGYWEMASDGGVFSFGSAPYEGSMGGTSLNEPIVGTATDLSGYWQVASDGGVFAFGDAKFYGSMGASHLNSPIVGMAATPDDGGYWLAAADGGIFAFGDAVFYGSMAGAHLDSPVVGIAGDPSTGGYWLVGADGGIFAFDAGFNGSTGAIHLTRSIVGISATDDGGGYWLVASDGGIFAFGNAEFYGSMGGRNLTAPVVGLSASPDGGGYWLVASDGGVFSFGDAAFEGSMGGRPLNARVLSVGTLGK
jgi:hypothetical protein